MSSVPLHLVSTTATKITLGWTPVPGAIGYRFQSAATAPKWSHTWDPTRSQVVFAKDQEPYVVQALGVTAEGSWPTTPPTAGLLGWGPAEQNQARQGWTPTRTIEVTNASAFWAAWYNLQAGDRIVCTEFAIPGSGHNFSKQLTARAEVIGLTLTGNGTRAQRAGDFTLRNVHFYDVDITNPNGRGWLLWDSIDASLWGKTHDCPAGGAGHWSLWMESLRCDMRGEIWNCGHESYDDAHPENPGTGIHAFYLAGNSYYSSDCLLSYDIHDQRTGAGISCGHHFRRSTIYVSGKRCTWPAVSSVAGNTLQFWGGYTSEIRIPYIYGEDNAGRVIEAEPGSNDNNPAGTCVVEHGRGVRCLKALYPGAPYNDRYFRPRAMFDYQDISPP